MTVAASTTDMTSAVSNPLLRSRFLRACRGEETDTTPIWMMRQAGRYMPEYRALRAKHTMLDLIHNADLSATVTLQPIDHFGFDAAIIFADILPPLVGMGLQLEFAAGEGPVIHNPLRRNYDIDMLATPPAEQNLQATLDAIAMVRRELEPRTIPLIGFAGAPFTLASYAIEGGTSKSFIKTKALMYGEPAAWKRLMTKLVTVQADYLIKQAQAGASALQIFDSWVGLALGKDAYLRFVAPFNRSLFELLRRAQVPIINFSTGTGSYIHDVAQTGGDVIGVDWRMPLSWYWQQIEYSKPIQGNLDPAALLAPWPELKFQVDDVLKQAAGRPGHIFNLGHGIFPETPVDNVRQLVEYVHSSGRRAGR
jgi:uroporphyrinogen decarboxylase